MNGASNMTGYLMFLNAQKGMNQFKETNQEFYYAFKEFFECYAGKRFPQKVSGYRVSVLMKLFVDNLGKKKLHNQSQQELIKSKLISLYRQYPQSYEQFKKLLLSYSWDKQYPIGYYRLIRLFLGENIDSVYKN